jgi:hypothetical protein
VEDTHNPNQLIVEGQDDLFAIAWLMRAFVDWPEGKGSKASAPVYIHDGNGADEILRDEYLPVFLKSPVLKAAGIVLDADAVPRGRYQSICQRCVGQFPSLPVELPKEGLIVENVQKKRLGIWIMPDNVSDGSLETFLKWLVPNRHDAAWKHAETSVQQARGMGCPCRDAHLEKANLYTWLAWQDPPGQNPGLAIAKKILDPQCPGAAPFVAWFTKLYQLPPKTKLFS